MTRRSSLQLQGWRNRGSVVDPKPARNFVVRIERKAEQSKLRGFAERNAAAQVEKRRRQELAVLEDEDLSAAIYDEQATQAIVRRVRHKDRHRSSGREYDRILQCCRLSARAGARGDGRRHRCVATLVIARTTIGGTGVLVVETFGTAGLGITRRAIVSRGVACRGIA